MSCTAAGSQNEKGNMGLAWASFFACPRRQKRGLAELFEINFRTLPISLHVLSSAVLPPQVIVTSTLFPRRLAALEVDIVTGAPARNVKNFSHNIVSKETATTDPTAMLGVLEEVVQVSKKKSGSPLPYHMNTNLLELDVTVLLKIHDAHKGTKQPLP